MSKHPTPTHRGALPLLTLAAVLQAAGAALGGEVRQFVATGFQSEAGPPVWTAQGELSGMASVLALKHGLAVPTESDGGIVATLTAMGVDTDGLFNSVFLVK